MAELIEIHGLENLGKCYNLLELDPLNIAASSKSLNAIDTAARAPESMGTQAYDVPPGVTVSSPFATDVKQFKSLIYNSHDLQREFSSSIEANSGVTGLFEFTASNTFKEITQVSASREHVFTYVMVNVQNHIASLNLRRAKDLRLTSDFREAVEDLSTDEDYADFISTFGTHFLSKVSLGGIAYSRVSTAAETAMSSKQSEDEFQTKASIEIKAFKAGTSVTQIKKDTEKREDKKQIDRTEIVFRGGIGNTQEIASDWYGTLKEQPVPIAKDTKLERLSKLLTAAFFPEDSNIAAKHKRLDQEITTYILQRGGELAERIRYGQRVELFTQLLNRQLYFERAQPKDDRHDVSADRLYPHHTQSRDHPEGRPATIVMQPSIKRGPEGDEAVSSSDVLVSLQVEEASRRYLRMPTSMQEKTLAFAAEAKNTGLWSVRVTGDLAAVHGSRTKPRPLVSGDVVLISRYDETTKRFWWISSDPTSAAVALYLRHSDTDPLFHKPEDKGARFVIRSAPQ